MKPILLKELREQYRDELKELYPASEIDSIFQMLMDHFFNFPRTLIALEPNKELEPADAKLLCDSLQELRANKPVQYVIGSVPFMGMDLRVSPAVLIPRPETEEMLQWILKETNPVHNKLRTIDIGTGSGCIALAFKKHFLAAEVHAMDLSQPALEIARKNAQEQNLELILHQGDICNPGKNWPVFDLLISNPPYVPEKEWHQMDLHVRDSEPGLALFVPDSDPLLIFRCICRFACENLKTGGLVYVEIHKDFGPQVRNLFREFGYTDIVLKKDIFGKDRFVRGRWTGSPPDSGNP